MKCTKTNFSATNWENTLICGSRFVHVTAHGRSVCGNESTFFLGYLHNCGYLSCIICRFVRMKTGIYGRCSLTHLTNFIMKNRLLKVLVILMMAGFSALGQTVTGRVTSAQDNAPLPGVSVLIKGTTIGTTTDVDGNYSIAPGSSENVVLSFSFIGFVTREIPLQGRTVVDVALEEDITQLGEVVVTAFGEQKEVGKIAYAVQEVDGDALIRANNANVVSPGLQNR